MRQDCLAPSRPLLTLPGADRAFPPLGTPSIAVLPFADAGGEFETQAFADGVTDALTETLARIRGLFVSGRNSAFTYRGHRPCPKEVGRRLGVAHVMDGEVHRQDDRIEIVAGLCDAASGRLLWRERLAGPHAALPRLQGALVARTVATIAPDLPFEADAIELARHPGDCGIYAGFLAACAQTVAGTEESLRALLGSLEAIAGLVPDHPIPQALRAQAYADLVVQGWSRDRAGDAAQGMEHARIALALMDGEDPAVLIPVGHALSVLTRDHGRALSFLDRALAINPNAAAGHERRGWVLCHVGRPMEALGHFGAALRLSPLDRACYRFEAGLGLALCMAGEPLAALPHLRRALNDAPSCVGSRCALAASLGRLGRCAEARAAADALRDEAPERLVAAWLLPFESSPGRERLIEGLRVAGLAA
ncbi:tetratricopeptide repeat protein [Methylobacterium sp. Leaf118]|uniref:tetratricopeptide repeat protein n=1 Tax=Methylobacterium sp. Leaf118 TaxID=2876562 RepID=UPI001E3A2AD7|nr:transcriptional regulator [Methylobacterium sp. Leaf118]